MTCSGFLKLNEEEKNEQAGAELCQAHVKLWLAKPCLPSKKMSMATSSNWKNWDVFHLIKLWSSSIWKKMGCLPFKNNWGRLPFEKNWGRLPFEEKSKVVFHKELAQLVEQVLQSWFCSKKLFDTFLVLGQRPVAGGNTDNRANSVQLQMQLPAASP